MIQTKHHVLLYMSILYAQPSGQKGHRGYWRENKSLGNLQFLVLLLDIDSGFTPTKWMEIFPSVFL